MTSRIFICTAGCILFLSACGSPSSQPSPTVEVQEAVSLPLSDAGPHFPGKRQYEIGDVQGGGRSLSITVWYPAIMPEGYAGTVARDAPADPTGAPYPLLLMSTTNGNEFAAHLASHGFVVAGVDGQGPSDLWGEWLVDYPLEILFTLDWIAAHPLGGLEGMVDAEHSGAMGYSFDGYNSLALSGARVDPEYYLAKCAAAATMEPAPEAWWIRYICTPAEAWDGFSAHAGEAITVSEDGLWQPMTDERILAVMPMAPEGAWLFGERGLAAVDRPSLIIGATEDTLCPYDLEAVFIFEHLGTSERAMISFVGQDHMMVFDMGPSARMGHFAVAFFGYYLQGHTEYAEYFSEAFVGQHEDLAWGVYAGN